MRNFVQDVQLVTVGEQYAQLRINIVAHVMSRIVTISVFRKLNCSGEFAFDYMYCSIVVAVSLALGEMPRVLTSLDRKFFSEPTSVKLSNSDFISAIIVLIVYLVGLVKTLLIKVKVSLPRICRKLHAGFLECFLLCVFNRNAQG